MSTMDNLMLGRHIHMKKGLERERPFISRFKTAKEEIKNREKVEEVITFLSCSGKKSVCYQSTYGTRKLVELGRAYSIGARG